jgi:predicted ATP-grasp superfamily ATP-dependent carboligase
MKLSPDSAFLDGSTTMAPAGNVLVFGDDMRIFLAVVRSLGRAGKTVHAAPFDKRAPALKSKFIAAIHDVPDYTSNPQAWQQAVSDILQEHRIDLVIPCMDPSIITLNRHREVFSGFRLAIPNAAAMEQLFDKELTHDLCVKLGVNVTRAQRLKPTTTSAELIAGFGLPLVIKPRKSYWLDQLDSWGRAYIVETEDDLRKLLANIADHERYLAVSYFDGHGCGISVLADNGHILQAFQHRRLREGRATASSYRISEELHPGMLRACEKISAEMNYTGVCMFEFRLNDETGDWVLIETNARFWGSMSLPVSLGVDFPNLLYDLMVLGLRHPPVRYALGIRARNFTLDGFNLLKELRRLDSGTIVPWMTGVADFCLQPLRWATGSERSDSFVADDMAPAFAEILTVLKLR